MEKMDVNELLDDAFVEEMIQATEMRIRKRKRIKSVCVSVMLLLLSIGLVQHEQISRAGGNLLYYAFGKNGTENMIKEENKVFVLKEPVKISEGDSSYTLEYAYLVNGELTVRIGTEKEAEALDGVILRTGGVNYFLGTEDTDCKNYFRGENEVEATIEGVTDNEFTINHAGKSYEFELEPTDGYTVDSLVKAKTGCYQATAMLLNREKAVFGVHINSPWTFSDWNVSIEKNPLSDDSNVYFIGDNGIKYNGVSYFDSNSYIPDVNQRESDQKTKPDFMCIRGITYYKQFDGKCPSFVTKLPKRGETIKLNKIVIADGIKIKILEVKATEDNKLRFKVSSLNSGSHDGKVFQAKFSVTVEGNADYTVSSNSDSISGLYIDGDKKYEDAGGMDIKKASYVYFYSEIPVDASLFDITDGQEVNVCLDYVELYINYPLIFRLEPEIYEK